MSHVSYFFAKYWVLKGDGYVELCSAVWHFKQKIYVLKFKTRECGINILMNIICEWPTSYIILILFIRMWKSFISSNIWILTADSIDSSYYLQFSLTFFYRTYNFKLDWIFIKNSEIWNWSEIRVFSFFQFFIKFPILELLPLPFVERQNLRISM